MNFSDLIKNRRSIRRFLDKKVPLNIIEEIINDSILAPNASNEQPWKFIIVNDMDIIKSISDESKKNILKRISENPDDYAKKYEGVLKKESYNVFYNAPSLVFILGESSKKNLMVDCALAASYFMMSATSRGLGTCWVNFGLYIKDPEMMTALGIPEDHKIVAPIILGYPDQKPSIPKRKEVEILKIIES